MIRCTTRCPSSPSAGEQQDLELVKACVMQSGSALAATSLNLAVGCGGFHSIFLQHGLLSPGSWLLS